MKGTNNMFHYTEAVFSKIMNYLAIFACHMVAGEQNDFGSSHVQ